MEFQREDKFLGIAGENKAKLRTSFILVADGNRHGVEQDIKGDYHFNGNFNNANSLKEALGNLDSNYDNLIASEEKLVLQIFEDIFDHKSFTGRSGTFFGYEGLGSIYWHMVSKLLLAVQENCLLAINTGENDVTIGKLLEHYYEINAGIGVHKSPELYGAFPTDPYSHTPATKGAQQPGMTGQVKEDILSRFGELGIFVEHGKLVFKPGLLQSKEFLNEASTFKLTNVEGKVQEIHLEAGKLGFTYCQVPIIYKKASETSVEIISNNGNKMHIDSLSLDIETSSSIFERKGEVNQIIVSVNK